MKEKLVFRFLEGRCRGNQFLFLYKLLSTELGLRANSVDGGIAYDKKCKCCAAAGRSTN